tara:strand:+ start:2951 stop:3148 length:198 start_codon:yes stop_codon:yes gene_type:complete
MNHKLTKEELATLGELKRYARMSKEKRIDTDIQNRLEQAEWDAMGRLAQMCYDNGIGVSDLQLDE